VNFNPVISPAFRLASTTERFEGGGNPDYGGGRIVFIFTGMGTGSNLLVNSLTTDGSAITKNLITGIDASKWNTYEIIFNNTSAAFYVNGALKFTHTTNLPTRTVDNVVFGFGNVGTDPNTIGFTDPIISQQI